MSKSCRLRRDERYAACADDVTVLPSKSLVLQGFFEGISAWVRCLYLILPFNRTNGYTASELNLLYENFMNFSIGGKLPMAKNENNFSYMTRRIGATTYKVKVVFNDTGTETMEDKILRIIRNSADTSGEKYDIINAPQMSRQSERSAS